MCELDYNEKVDTVNDTLTKVLEDYVTKRNKYHQLADTHYAMGYLDAPIKFEPEYNDYIEAKQLLIEIMFDGKTINQIVRCLEDHELM